MLKRSRELWILAICGIINFIISAVAMAEAPTFKESFLSNHRPVFEDLYNQYYMIQDPVIPHARFEPAGTIKISYKIDNGYETASVGTQLTPAFFLSIRQSAWRGSGEDHLFPGIDWKYKIWEETSRLPALAVGMNSFLGHRRFAGEYVVANKMIGNFDVAGGVGWGRQSGGVGNLFKNITLDKHRYLADENPSIPQDWFTGNSAVFGGVSYRVPHFNGLTLYAAMTGENLDFEKHTITDFKPPEPWSLGASYKASYFPWLQTGVHWLGNDNYIAQVSIAWSPEIDGKSIKSEGILKNHNDHKVLFNWCVVIGNCNSPSPQRLMQDIYGLSNVYLTPSSVVADLELTDRSSKVSNVPMQIKAAAKYLRTLSSATRPAITLRLYHRGMKGREITLRGADFDDSLGAAFKTTHEEIWHHMSEAIFNAENSKPAYSVGFLKNYSIDADWLNDISISEDDGGVFYRTALVPTITYFGSPESLTVFGLRINLADNLTSYRDYRYNDPAYFYSLPVRSDIDLFTAQRLVLDKYYKGAFYSWNQELYTSYSVGYLEEMYAGLSAETLYRPFGKKYAFGLELDQAFKREPQTLGALGLNGDHVLSGFINGYYELDDSKTLSLSVGRYLAEDIGATLGFDSHLNNGVLIKAYLTATDETQNNLSGGYDHDIYGAKMNVNAGLKISVPLDFIPSKLTRSRIVSNIGSLGRDRGQKLDKPMPLYELTEPLSERALMRHWSD